jgi:flavin reductase (DIM6/NTAB) family NADH-FMN oxidoreductase RutF
MIGADIGPWNHSFKALRATKECVIAIPTVDLASKAVEIGNCSGKDIDKFDVFGLTPVPDLLHLQPIVVQQSRVPPADRKRLAAKNDLSGTI